VADRIDATKLAAARLLAATEYPFLGVALYALTPVTAPGLGTFAVDERWRLSIDPDVLARWTTPEVAGVLLHEVGHVVRFHAARARDSFVDDSTAFLWNVAGDAEINDDLLNDGIELPDSPITPAMLRMPRGKAAEFYFVRLLGASLPPRCADPGCGAGAHGRNGPEVDSTVPGVAPDEADLIRRRVAVDILSGRKAGRGAAGWSRWASSFLEPKIDWRREFGSAIRGAISEVVTGRTDYRYHRPSRRRVPNVILPSLVRPVPTVAVVIDTSGSMSSEAISRAWTEVLGMLSRVGVRADRIRMWSTDVHAHRVAVHAAREIELVGGGGTDMGAGIAAAMRDRPPPDVIVVLTDGETPWPLAGPGRPVIVGVIGEPQMDWVAQNIPSWARMISIPIE
jgi:predicted metal-dependent peptidase